MKIVAVRKGLASRKRTEKRTETNLVCELAVGNQLRSISQVQTTGRSFTIAVLEPNQGRIVQQNDELLAPILVEQSF